MMNLFYSVLILGLTLSCSSVERENTMQKLLGETESTLLGELGHPIGEDTILFFEEVKLLEYQSSLYDKVSLKNESKVLIKEFFWLDGDFKIVVWLQLNDDGLWKVIDFLSWNQKKISY